MLTLTVTKAVRLLATLLLMSVVMTWLPDFLPGDPAAVIAGETASPDEIERVRRDLRLDEPILERYTTFISGAVTGDLGESVVLRQGVPITQIVGEAIPATLSVMLFAFVFAHLVAVVWGFLAAVRRGKLPDHLLRASSAVALAFPTFVIAIGLVVLFSVELRWLPAVGYVGPTAGIGDWIRSMILPGLALAIVPGAIIARQVRASVLDVLDKDYVRAAEAKGLSRSRIMRRHVARNAAIPVLTVSGVQVAQMVGGSVIIEYLFVLDGLGSSAYEAALRRDIPLLRGVVLVVTVFVLLVNLLVDVSYGHFDARLRRTA